MQGTKRTTIGRTQFKVCGAAFLDWLFDGFEMGLFPIVARPAVMDMCADQDDMDTYVTTKAFYGWFPLYLPELFPSSCRATGQGIEYNMSRIMQACCAIMRPIGGTF